jgi:aspartate/methionine/tyrosine aminotransferase
VPVPVVTDSLDLTLSLPLIKALKHAFESSPIPIKGILMTNPNNPLGQCYSQFCIEECIKFCQRRNIHYISDEVYALTRIECPELLNPQPFVSALSVDVEKLGCDISRVHTVWSTSKDFGQSGVRMVCVRNFCYDESEIKIGRFSRDVL